MNFRITGLLVCVALSGWVGVSHAQELAFSRVLIPLYGPPTRGALGSEWHVESWVRNNGTTAANIAPPPQCTFTCPSIAQLQPGEGPVRVSPIFLRTPGVLFHVDGAHAQDVAFTTRVRDVTRQAESAGTMIPAVPEDKFSGTAQVLLSIPIDQRFRITLRVYGLPEATEPAVDVRYYRLLENGDPSVVPLRTDRVALQTYGVNGRFFFEPSYAERGNVQSLPEIALEKAVWIEVIPVTAGLRIWPMISITNNATQQVTIVTP